MWWLAYCLSVCHYFSVERWPLSVHLVKGLSAAGVEVERARGAAEFRLHLKSVCLWVHVDGRGAVQLVREERERREGGRDGVYAAATLIQDSHHRITFSPLNQPKTPWRWTSHRKCWFLVPGLLCAWAGNYWMLIVVMSLFLLHS